jgi:outer membrane lipoprotein carrier protein
MRTRLRFFSVVLAVAVPALAIPLPPFAGIARADGPAASQPQLTALPADKTAQMIGKVQDFYDKTSNFQADFSQEYLVKQYNKKKSSHGHVVFDKPGKMSWTYLDPAGNRVVSDGKKLKVYEADSKQLYEQDVTASQYPAALAFLTGQGKLADVFDFTAFEGAQMSFPGGAVLVGVPKTATPAYQKVLFYVDNASSQITRVLIIDGQGNHNRFDFVHPVINQKLPPGQFAFSPPPGTTTIHP